MAIKIIDMLLYLLTIHYFWISDGANILSYPVAHFKNSGSRNAEKILAILAEDGHRINIIANEQYEAPSFLQKYHPNVIRFPRPKESRFSNGNYNFQVKDYINDPYVHLFDMLEGTLQFCEAFLNSTESIQRIKKEKFDLLFLQFEDPCGYILASMLPDVPSITLTFSYGVMPTRTLTQPQPYSYIPNVGTNYTPNMGFLQRVMNTLLHVGLFALDQAYMYTSVVKRFPVEKYGIQLKEQKQMDTFILSIGGFPVDFPLPVLPDVAFIGTTLVSKAKPLSNELETFIQSSGDLGIVVVSFGSILTKYDDHLGNVFAEAFASLPQKVLWKYVGEKPARLGNNTKLVEWLPQTDVLAHEKTKLFVSHCGINSAFEAIHYGVPVLALPINGDQFSNAAKVVFHNTGKRLDIRTITVETFKTEMEQVLGNPVYKENAVRLSEQIRDTPVSGKELIQYWAKYVVRHNGTNHLKPYGRFLPWYQYYLLDVVTFILGIVALCSVMIFQSCKLVCCKSYQLYSLKTKTE